MSQKITVIVIFSIIAVFLVVGLYREREISVSESTNETRAIHVDEKLDAELDILLSKLSGFSADIHPDTYLNSFSPLELENLKELLNIGEHIDYWPDIIRLLRLLAPSQDTTNFLVDFYLSEFPEGSWMNPESSEFRGWVTMYNIKAEALDSIDPSKYPRVAVLYGELLQNFPSIASTVKWLGQVPNTEVREAFCAQIYGFVADSHILSGDAEFAYKVHHEKKKIETHFEQNISIFTAANPTSLNKEDKQISDAYSQLLDTLFLEYMINKFGRQQALDELSKGYSLNLDLYYEFSHAADWFERKGYERRFR